MSVDLTDLKNPFGLSADEKRALELAGSVIGAVSSVWGSVNSAKSVLTTLGILPSPTGVVDDMRKLIDQLAQRFDGVLHALDVLTAMVEVATQLANARTALQNLIEFAPTDASAVGVNPYWDGLRPLVLYNSALVVQTLGSPAYWQRVYFDELKYQHWFPRALRSLGPPHPGGLVFDYRLTLPAYVESISIRVTILLTAVKEPSKVAAGELKTIADTLEGYFATIRAGMFPVTRAPNDYDSSNADDYATVTWWIADGSRVGVAEWYSAVDRVSNWPPSEYPVSGFSGQSDPNWDHWKQFVVRYAVREWMRWKQLYHDIGLAAAERTIVTLKKMAGVVPAKVDGPGGDYSLRELAQVLYHCGDDQQGEPTFLADEHNKLIIPISLREMLRVMQTYRTNPYTSVREALAQ